MRRRGLATGTAVTGNEWRYFPDPLLYGKEGEAAATEIVLQDVDDFAAAVVLIRLVALIEN